MKRIDKKFLRIAACLLVMFTLWTIAVCCVDVQPIGPRGSFVGFAALNGWFHDLTGVHMDIYTMTDWLSLVPLGIVCGFGMLGLAQWIGRKSIRRVDRSILALGGFYITVMAVFALFEVITVNYRPVLIEGALEVSYPSSTTMLVMCVIPTAVMQLNERVKDRTLRWCVAAALTAFMAFMVLSE